MRKLITVLSLAALTAAALSTSAMARPGDTYYPTRSEAYVAPVVGAAVGTAVGVGLYNGWYTTSGFIGTLPTTAAGAAVVGGVAGVGTVALIDSIFQPCRGFHALFGMNHGACANGEYVGYEQPRHMSRR
jgi:hypothetical protein